MSERKDKFLRILVGIDGSQSSIDAAGYAIEMAKRDNAELIAIHVLSTKLGEYEHTPKPLLFGLPATPSSINNIIETSEQEAQRWLNRIKQQLLDDENNQIKIITAILIASTERIAAEIVDYAQLKNVDLIVLGTKGRSSFKKLLLGSVASEVVTHAHCPVLIVK
ncbi:MAG: universal stress protein [Candidatus Nitrosopolaris sp.]